MRQRRRLQRSWYSACPRWFSVQRQTLPQGGQEQGCGASSGTQSSSARQQSTFGSQGPLGRAGSGGFDAGESCDGKGFGVALAGTASRLPAPTGLSEAPLDSSRAGTEPVGAPGLLLTVAGPDGTPDLEGHPLDRSKTSTGTRMRWSMVSEGAQVELAAEMNATVGNAEAHGAPAQEDILSCIHEQLLGNGLVR